MTNTIDMRIPQPDLGDGWKKTGCGLCAQDCGLEVLVAIPHGFGLDYDGETDGVNVNRITPSRHRDPIAGTPLHKHVPCRVEAISAE